MPKVFGLIFEMKKIKILKNMSWIDNIKQAFAPAPVPLELTQDNVDGLVMGAAVGESMGIPVVDRSPDDLRQNPVTELLGFADYRTPPGTYSISTDSLLDFARYLSQNHNGGYTVDRFFQLCNNWYLYKARDEEYRLRIMLPCAALAGMVYSGMDSSLETVLRNIPDLLCDSGLVSSSMVFYMAQHIALGYPLARAAERARNKSAALCKRVGVSPNPRGLSIRVANVVIDCVSASSDYSSGLLATVNSGMYPDLTGNISGILLGFFYGMENIPYLWRNSVNNLDHLPEISSGIIKILR